MSDFISVVEDTGGLLVAVGRKWSVTRASVKKSGPPGGEATPEFAKGTGENSVSSQNKALLRSFGLVLFFPRALLLLPSE